MIGALVRLDLRRQKRRAVMVVVAVALCVSVLCGSTGLLLGIYRGVVQPLLPRLPVGMFEVEGRRVDVGILSFGGLGAQLDRKAVERLRAIEHVVAAHPVTSSDVPMRATGGESVLGRRVHTDVFALGVPDALVAEDLPDVGFEASEDRIPVLISPRLLALYNKTVAPALSKPRLAPDAVIGLQFELLLGSSATQGSVGRHRREVGEVIGFSERANLGGITVPQSVVDRWDEEYDTESPITSIWVQVDPPDRARQVFEAIEQAGFRVDEGPKLVAWALALALGLGAGAIVGVGGLAALVSGLTFSLVVAERRTEIAVLRSLGARRREVRAWIGREALMLGAIGGVVGSMLGAGVGALAASGLDRAFGGLVESESWFVYPVWLWVGGVVLGAVSAWLGALVPARRAARLDPALSLRS